jgi:lipoprotein-anchoring transpeptidase ErfK/SrfK
VRSISRKTALWASGATIAIAGGGAGLAAATHAGGASAAGGRAAGTAATARPPAVKPAPLAPLRVVSISPASGSRAANGADPITVTYNRPLPVSAALPRLSPAIAGTWRRAGDAAVFTAATGYPAGTRITVTVAGQGNPRDRSGQSSVFTTGEYSTLRLQQILAQLGYLPLTWTRAAGGAAAARDAAAQLAAAYAPPAGDFGWRPGYPAELRGFWRQGSANTLDAGAITGFEADHGLATDGLAGTAVWTALLRAAATGQRNAHGYSYAVASQRLPETLTIWHDGKRVLSSPTNTGISVAPSPVGTFPVYEKLPFQIMQGTNPDGSRYADPVRWVSYFNGGAAVHYFDRGSYGWPQSLGCVELPYAAAAEAYPYLPYGTLVTVTP